MTLRFGGRGVALLSSDFQSGVQFLEGIGQGRAHVLDNGLHNLPLFVVGPPLQEGPHVVDQLVAHTGHVSRERPCYIWSVTADALDGRLLPGPDLLATLVRFLGLSNAQGEGAELSQAEQEVEAYADLAHELTRAAATAMNVAMLRQRLDEIGLSPAFAALTLNRGGSSSASSPPDPDYRFIPSARMVDRLGKPAADLLVEVVELAAAVMRAEEQSRAAQPASEPSAPGPRPSPAELSAWMHALVLGDLVSPGVAQLLLGLLRGVAAILWLIAVAGGREQSPEWKNLAAGDMALEGMKALQTLLQRRIDIVEELEAYEAFKIGLFERLGEPRPHAGTEEPAAKPRGA